MNWPVTNTDEIKDLKRLAVFFKEKTPKEIAAMEFWPGDYGDFSTALMLAGWEVIFCEEYWFAARKLNQSQYIEYIEGDIYIRDNLQSTQLHAHRAKVIQ